MKYIHYIAIAVTGIIITILAFGARKKSLMISGIAETKETAINYNLPVLVKEIYVSPGDFVTKGTPLLTFSIVKTKNELSTSSYEINKIKADEQYWKEVKTQQINELLADQELIIHDLSEKISRSEQELMNKRFLSKNISSLKMSDSIPDPLAMEIRVLKEKKALMQKKYNASLTALNQQKSSGTVPLLEEIKRLNAELSFEQNEADGSIVIYAPRDGIVGDIFCKSNTNMPNFSTLLSFYEPNPEFIKGYVYEGATVEVNIGDEFKITSSLNDTLDYKGVVTGLGSRIIEIPERLRKNTTIKSYGREVTVKISNSSNRLLQKEKVVLEHLPKKEDSKFSLSQLSF